MANQSVSELKNLAALYALGHLQGKERPAFEALLQDPQSEAAAYLGQLQPVVEALAWAVTPKEPSPQLRTRLLERVRQEARATSAASRISLAPGLLLVLADKLAWKETAVPGIRYKTLFVDRERRYATSLVAMAPGTRYPRHRHTQTEELFLLSGDIQIDGYPRYSPATIPGQKRALCMNPSGLKRAAPLSLSPLWMMSFSQSCLMKIRQAHPAHQIRDKRWHCNNRLRKMSMVKKIAFPHMRECYQSIALLVTGYGYACGGGNPQKSHP